MMMMMMMIESRLNFSWEFRELGDVMGELVKECEMWD